MLVGLLFTKGNTDATVTFPSEATVLCQVYFTLLAKSSVWRMYWLKPRPPLNSWHEFPTASAGPMLLTTNVPLVEVKVPETEMRSFVCAPLVRLSSMTSRPARERLPEIFNVPTDEPGLIAELANVDTLPLTVPFPF